MPTTIQLSSRRSAHLFSESGMQNSFRIWRLKVKRISHRTERCENDQQAGRQAHFPPIDRRNLTRTAPEVAPGREQELTSFLSGLKLRD